MTRESDGKRHACLDYVLLHLHRPAVVLFVTYISLHSSSLCIQSQYNKLTNMVGVLMYDMYIAVG